MEIKMKLMVAVDFSDPTDKILRVTKQLAKNLDAFVWVVHAAEPDPDFVGYDAGPEVVRGQVAKELRDEHRQLQKYADELREAGVDAKAMLVRGPTVKALLEMAGKQGADMIIVGSHGRGMVADILLGSVSQGLIKSARCPVTVVPASSSDPTS
ncbi:MAG: universal stress protein [Gammaproteobacteria bacterium]|nr:universal stress protein [Gammaproteobacteria bacterium]